MSVSWPEDNICYLCNTKYSENDIIIKIPFEKPTNILVQLFLNRKLNSNVSNMILKYLNHSSYAHSNCVKKHCNVLNHTNIYEKWYLCSGKKMYLSNQYYN